MSPKEEIEVRELVSRTTETLHRASAGPDDMGSRYARLLELLWKPRSSASVTSSESRRRNDLSIANLANSSAVSDGGSAGGAGHSQQQNQHHHQQQQSTHFDPANDFSWLDLGAVGDYVSGDLMTANVLGFESGSVLQDTGSGLYGAVGGGQQQPTQQHQQQQQQQQLWQTPLWTGDSMSTSLYF